MPRLPVLALLALFVVVAPGCKSLPNADVDDLSRSLRKLDAAQRPNGEDLPVERFFAWTADRDAGLRAPDDLDIGLRAIIEEQRALGKRLTLVPTPTPESREIVKAYRNAHDLSHLGMEEVLAGRRLGDPGRVQVGERQARAVLEALRAARAVRKARCEMIGLTDAPPAAEVEAPGAGGAIGREASSSMPE